MNSKSKIGFGIFCALIIFTGSFAIYSNLTSPWKSVKADLNNIWYVPAQYLPASATDVSALSGAVNIPTTPANLDLHLCEFAVFASTSGSSATVTIQDKQTSPIKYFDAVTVVSVSAGSFNKILEAKGPEGCIYFKGGIKVNASAGTQIYFTMKGYY